MMYNNISKEYDFINSQAFNINKMKTISKRLKYAYILYLES
jgi:hypothetical protein